MLKNFKKKFIGDKAFYAMVLGITVPIIIQNGITNFVNLLDNIMVGQLGTEQMSGVSIVNQLIFVYNLCIFGGLSGAGIFTSQYYGQKDDEGIRHTFRYKLWMAVILTAGAIALFMLIGDSLINLYLSGSSDGGDLAATLSYGRTYLNIMLFGLPAFMMLQVYASTLRECGETVVPMKAGMAAVLVNLVFNYFLIYGKFGFPKLGVAGAAIATVMSRYVEAFIVIWWTHKHTEKNSYIIGMYRTLKVPLSVTKKIFIKGTPLLLNEALWSSGMAMLSQCYSVRGLNVVAGLNIANTVNNLFSVVFLALGNAVAIIVGQLLGAGKMKEARDTDNKLLVFAVAASTGIAFIMLVLSPYFPLLYNTSDAVRTQATKILIAQAIFMPQAAFLNATYFTLRAGGKTVITFFFDCAFVWLVSIPVVFLLSRFTGMPAHFIYACGQIAEWGKCVLGFILVKKGVWIQNIVKDS
ncbi:MAG: MATE family efflux transporter [Lachnospiraceae bacterium]|nr:MATE family efflux transporter [Lachnospiraceae bacterium]